MKEAKSSPDPKKSKKISFKKLFVILVILTALIITIAAGLYFFNEYQKSQKLLNNPQAMSAEDNRKVILAVGKLIMLPNETPSVATISDISKLSGQTLFQNAVNGDKVLIFDKAKRAIVYRPSENKIIEIGNVVVAPKSSPSANPEIKTVKVVIYNGTGTAGYAKSEGRNLTSKFSNLEIAKAENASNEYEKTVVVDLTKNNSDLVKKLAEELKGSVGTLPKGEVKPENADILIILGK